MCNQREGIVNSRGQNGKINKEDKNVTSKKEKGRQRAQNEHGAGNRKGSQNCKGDVVAATAAAGRNQGDSGSTGPRSAASGKPHASGSRARREKDDQGVRLQLPSSHNNGGHGTSNSTPRLSRHNSTDRPVPVVQRVWKASEVRTRLRKDGLSCNYKLDQEELCITTWSALFVDLCPIGLPYFKKSIETLGLEGTITRFQGIATVIINNDTPSLVEEDFVRILRTLSVKDALQLLRFGKRYTPLVWSDDMEADVISRFHQRNNRAKMRDRVELPYWFAQRLSCVGAELWEMASKGKDFDSFIGERSYLCDLNHIPHGTTADGLRNPFEKWLYVSALWGVLQPNQNDAIQTREIGSRDDVYSKLVMVPKDYRGPRIIMEELLEVTLQQSMTADALYKIIGATGRTKRQRAISPAHAIVLNDQTQNQEMARLGGEFGYHSTVDLKDASDSITYQLIQAVFPVVVSDRILEHVTRCVELPNGKRYVLHMPCTMGSRNTVPVQSLIYWVIVVVAVDILVELGVLPDHEVLYDCSVYNDDIVIPYMLYDTVCDLLELAGLIVNHDKSYTDAHPFRESCGVDMYYDAEVTSVYWPRRELHVVNDELPSLCALQNRLYSINAMHAASVIEGYVVTLFPKVPYVNPGSEFVGLYAPYTNCQYTPYKCDMYDVVTTYEHSIVPNGPYHERLILSPLSKNSHRSGWSITRFGDLKPMLDELRWVNDITLYHDALHTDCERIDPDDIRNNDGFGRCPVTKSRRRCVIPNVYRAHQSRIVPTFNNRKIGKLCYDSDVITPKVIAQLFELFEYERWLRIGSEYYDDLCKTLHVTQPSRMRDRLYADGYKVGATSYLVLEPSVVEAFARDKAEKEERKRREEEERKKR